MTSLTRPIISEKSFLLASENKYTFSCPVKLSKTEAKNIIENLYKVDVSKINTMKPKGKIKVTRGKVGRRQDIKKFIFTLKKGQKIDLFDIEEKADKNQAAGKKIDKKEKKAISKDSLKSQLLRSRKENNPTALSQRSGEN